MLSRLAADLVLLSHFAFVLFAVFGAFLSLLNPVWAWIHIPAVLWSSIVNLKSWTCPLTPVEKALRAESGQAGYEGGCVQHYVGRLVYPRGMPRQMELIAGVSVIAANVLFYDLVWFWLMR